MEHREAGLKVEDPLMMRSSSSFLDNLLGSYNNNALTGNFVDYCGDEKGGCLGFMELLGMPPHQDHFGFSSSPFDLPHPQDLPQTTTSENKIPANSTVAESSSGAAVDNAPATPNVSSISTESSGAPNEEQSKGVDDDEEQHNLNTKKHSKVKKSSQKMRQRQARFAFMTKSDVDHLEDGYRWRKYGQKAVKNSPFPRSYYRCTSASCNVKKRVERCLNDPSIVVTTYEGQHTHPSPMMSRPSPAGLPPSVVPPAAFSAHTAAGPFTLPMQMSLSHRLHFNNSSTNINFNSTTDSMAELQARRRFCSPAAHSGLLIRDHGLLQDIVPSIVNRERD